MDSNHRYAAYETAALPLGYETLELSPGLEPEPPRYQRGMLTVTTTTAWQDSEDSNPLLAALEAAPSARWVSY